MFNVDTKGLYSISTCEKYSGHSVSITTAWFKEIKILRKIFGLKTGDTIQEDIVVCTVRVDLDV
jgi:hypothetical protein